MNRRDDRIVFRRSIDEFANSAEARMTRGNSIATELNAGVAYGTIHSRAELDRPVAEAGFTTNAELDKGVPDKAK